MTEEREIKEKEKACFKNKMVSFCYKDNDLTELLRLRQLKKKLKIVGKYDERLPETAS